jgi:signal transduction histidine kinase
VGGGLISFLLALSFYALQVAVMKTRRISNLSGLLQAQNRQLEETVAERTCALSEQNELLNQHVTSLEQQKVSLSLLMKESESAKQSAQDLAQELARSNRDLDDFAYVASHDLKTPLRGISQLSNWVLEDIEEGKFEEVPQNLTLINSRVKRLDTLLNDLLEYSRANRQQASLALLDTQELIEGLFPLYSPNDKFELEIVSPLPVFETLKSPFEQVVRNLLNNACKHHGKGEGLIQISCEESDEFYTFMVKDDGPGIEADYFEEIFKMFKTLKPRDEVEGSGMGLALIKKIVEHYGGKVYLESEVGKGSAFYFTWPKLMKSEVTQDESFLIK